MGERLAGGPVDIEEDRRVGARWDRQAPDDVMDPISMYANSLMDQEKDTQELRREWNDVADHIGKCLRQQSVSLA